MNFLKNVSGEDKQADLRPKLLEILGKDRALVPAPNVLLGDCLREYMSM